MASRPPEDDAVNDDAARNRWMVMNAVRFGGLVIALVGILGLGRVFEYPHIVAYVLVAAGLFDFFVVPLLLAKKWRTPDA